MSDIRHRRDLLLLMGIAVTAAVAGVAVGGGSAAPGASPAGGVDALRGLAGLLLALPLPGYALMRAMFAGRLPEPVQQLALVIGLGLSLSILAGFLLHFVPVGMSRGSWAATLAGLTVIVSLIALSRELRLPVAQQALAGVQQADAGAQPLGRLGGSQARMLGAAVLIGLAAFAVARVGAAEQPYPGFTQLWVLPGSDSSISVGVHNREGSDQRYTLRLSAGGEALGAERAVALADGQTFQVQVRLPASLTMPGSGATVEAILERQGESDPYRRVLLRLGQDAAVTSAP